MSTAEFIVNQLLENEGVVRVCAGCQKEFGTASPPGASHGYCKRHTLAMYRDLMQTVAQRGDQNKLRELHRSVQEIKARPDEAFCPDQSQQRQAPSAGVAQ